MTIRKFFFYLMVGLYILSGLTHFIKPDFYLELMPSFLPQKMLLTYVTGVLEIALALLLLRDKYQKLAANLIILMLLGFLILIHIPQTIDFYNTKNELFTMSVIRLSVQVLLLFWAWSYTRKPVTFMKHKKHSSITH